MEQALMIKVLVIKNLAEAAQPDIAATTATSAGRRTGDCDRSEQCAERQGCVTGVDGPVSAVDPSCVESREVELIEIDKLSQNSESLVVQDRETCIICSEGATHRIVNPLLR